MAVVDVIVEPSFLNSNFLLLTLCQKISVIKQQTIYLKCERTSMRINSRCIWKGDEWFGTVLMRNALCVAVVKHTKIATPNECAHQQTVHVMSSVRSHFISPVHARTPDYIAQYNTSVLHVIVGRVCGCCNRYLISDFVLLFAHDSKCTWNRAYSSLTQQ